MAPYKRGREVDTRKSPPGELAGTNMEVDEETKMNAKIMHGRDDDVDDNGERSPAGNTTSFEERLRRKMGAGQNGEAAVDEEKKKEEMKRDAKHMDVGAADVSAGKSSFEKRLKIFLPKG